MSDPWWMGYRSLRELLESGSVRGSERKHRLFAVACAFLSRGDLAERQCRMALAVVEEFADGLTPEKKLSAARRNLTAREAGTFWELAQCAAHANGYAAAYGAAAVAARTATGNEAKEELLSLVRDLFGRPSSAAPGNAAWLRWNDGTVPRIAQAIYEERAFDRMPILHDALLDAGCDNEDILAHCRGEGPHVRGCWVIDLLLGNE